MESTEDIYRAYLKRANEVHPSTGNHFSTHIDDEYDFISLHDPLDDDTPETSTGSLVPSSPPTPLESPLYPHANYRSSKFTQRGRGMNDIDLTFSLSDVENIRSLDGGLANIAKDNERFQKLSASATEKLMERLRLEQARNVALQQRLDSMVSEQNDAKVTKGDYELLLRENIVLKEQLSTLNVQLHNVQMKSPQSARENQLLREKLLKYKTLYEDLKRAEPAAEPAAEAQKCSEPCDKQTSAPTPAPTNNQAYSSESRNLDSMAMSDLFAMVERLEEAQKKQKMRENSFHDIKIRLKELLGDLRSPSCNSERTALAAEAPEPEISARGIQGDEFVGPSTFGAPKSSRHSETTSVPSSRQGPRFPILQHDPASQLNYSPQLTELVGLLQRICQEVEHFSIRQEAMPTREPEVKKPSSSCKSCASVETEQRSFNAFSADGEETRDLRGTWAWSNSI